MNATTDLWLHQEKGIADVREAIARGDNRILLTAPTGAGKSRIICELIEGWCGESLKTVLYTNRKMLLDQISKVIGDHGIWHGVRAATYADDRDYPVQVSSIQTEASRVLKKKEWKLHGAHRVIVDEAHVNKGDVARTILAQHEKEGAVIVGFTATPIDMGDLYSSLIVAGTNSELKTCGALLPAWHYGPDEPDLKKIKFVEGQDLTHKENSKAMMTATIFSRVYESWMRLNPDARPAIGFAPGVPEARWFCEDLAKRGVPCAAIDGIECWIGGESFKTSKELRAEIIGGSKDGKYKIVWNRFVLREGIDAPWLYHGILATIFGSLQSYIQSGGRLLRAYPGMDHVVIQDHGGSWHRHGSLNSDWQWELGCTSARISGLHLDSFRDKSHKEPQRCPHCERIFNGMLCPCGYEVPKGSKRVRPVVQIDGTLKEMTGDIYRPRQTMQNQSGAKIWERMYYRSRKAGRTFRQAEALFAMENNWQWPDKSWPLMPIDNMDRYARVDEVPRERLRH